MSTVVFFVESGEYDDCRVDAVFTDRERADAYAAWLNGPGGSYRRVREEEVNPSWPENSGRFIAEGAPEEVLEKGDRLWVRWDPDDTSRSNVQDDGRGRPWIVGRGKTREAALAAARRLALRRAAPSSPEGGT